MDSKVDMAFMEIWVKISELCDKDNFLDNFSLTSLSLGEDSSILNIYETSLRKYVWMSDDDVINRSDLLMRDLIFSVQSYMITKGVSDKESVMKAVRNRILIQRESIMTMIGKV